MGQFFVFTAGNPAARAHLDDSIISPVPVETIIDFFATDEDRAQIQAINDAQGLYAWGAVPGVRNVPSWESMQADDWVLCVYGNTYHYVARVLTKHHNPEAARAIWGSTEGDDTWEYMYFLTKPEKISVPVGDVADCLHGGYRGFSRISDAATQRIVDEYGSIQQFIETRLKGATDVGSACLQQDYHRYRALYLRLKGPGRNRLAEQITVQNVAA